MRSRKSGEKWQSGGKEMDSTSVQAFLDKLRDLSASKFVDTGFTSPAIDLDGDLERRQTRREGAHLKDR